MSADERMNWSIYGNDATASGHSLILHILHANSSPSLFRLNMALSVPCCLPELEGPLPRVMLAQRSTCAWRLICPDILVEEHAAPPKVAPIRSCCKCLNERPSSGLCRDSGGAARGAARVRAAVRGAHSHRIAACGALQLQVRRTSLMRRLSVLGLKFMGWDHK